jgi:glycosyltransferase involved in cell wall biosynthesis
MHAAPKVVFFHPYFSDGGVERTNLGLARGLIGLGYKVAFVTIQPTAHFVDEVRALGIEWVVLPAKSTLAAQPGFVHWLHQQRSLASGCPSRLIVISCQYYVNLACLIFRPLWGRRMYVRHILSERNHLDEFQLHSGIKYSLIKCLVRYLYRYADTVIANSQELASDLSRATGRMVGVVYNPTVNDRLYRLAKEPVTESWYGIEKTATIVAIGRLSPQKDFANLIRAFAILRKTTNARLIILGEGPERELLGVVAEEQGVSRDVLLPGFVENPYKFLKKSDLFVLSSAYEGLPNVLIEALALKVPVISTACRSGPAEILKNGEFGQLVPVGDPQALAKAMQNVFDDLGKASAMAESAEPALHRFTLDGAVSSLTGIFAQMHLNSGNGK